MDLSMGSLGNNADFPGISRKSWPFTVRKLLIFHSHAECSMSRQKSRTQPWILWHFFAETVVFHWSTGISDRSIWAKKNREQIPSTDLVMFECCKESECVKQQRTGDSTAKKPSFDASGDEAPDMEIWRLLKWNKWNDSHTSGEIGLIEVTVDCLILNIEQCLIGLNWIHGIGKLVWRIGEYRNWIGMIWTLALGWTWIKAPTNGMMLVMTPEKLWWLIWGSWHKLRHIVIQNANCEFRVLCNRKDATGMSFTNLYEINRSRISWFFCDERSGFWITQATDTGRSLPDVAQHASCVMAGTAS